METNLNDLRKHVWELMQVIVPELELENLEMVDQVVIEMVRVNKGETRSNENSQKENNSHSAIASPKRKDSTKTNSKVVDNDETQDPTGEAVKCNGVAESNEMNGNTSDVDIKGEETETQSQSLISNVWSTSAKER